MKVLVQDLNRVCHLKSMDGEVFPLEPGPWRLEKAEQSPHAALWPYANILCNSCQLLYLAKALSQPGGGPSSDTTLSAWVGGGSSGISSINGYSDRIALRWDGVCSAPPNVGSCDAITEVFRVSYIRDSWESDILLVCRSVICARRFLLDLLIFCKAWQA